tara:strand:- start:12165 stop:12920 length:756 start_codon:yes stop_codon:yes gene_type:complete
MEMEFFSICLGLFLISILYSSVGHGGASGYLAVLSLSVYGGMGNSWLKQYAWCLNLFVAAIAFYHYYKAGYFNKKLSLPFIIGSVPFAIIGGFLRIDGIIYDSLLSITLIWAAYKLYQTKKDEGEIKNKIPNLKVSIPTGAGIGFASGIIGVGGGIFLSPIILLKKWADPKTVAATSALFIWINSLGGLFGAGISNQLNIDLDILLPFILVVLMGGYLGSKFGSKSNNSIIKSLLIIVLLIAALKRFLEYL